LEVQAYATYVDLRVKSTSGQQNRLLVVTQTDVIKSCGRNLRRITPTRGADFCLLAVPAGRELEECSMIEDVIQC